MLYKHLLSYGLDSMKGLVDAPSIKPAYLAFIN